MLTFHIEECTLFTLKHLNACTTKIRSTVVYGGSCQTTSGFIIQYKQFIILSCKSTIRKWITNRKYVILRETATDCIQNVMTFLIRIMIL